MSSKIVIILIIALIGAIQCQLLGLGARTPVGGMNANADYGSGYGSYGGGYGGYGSGYGGYGTNANLGANVAGLPLNAGLGLGR